MIRSILALAISTIVVAEFATTGPLGNEVLDASMNAKIARVVIDRKSMMGFGGQPDYVVDGKYVAASKPGGFVSCDMQPVIAVTNPAISNNLTGVGSENFSLDLRAGRMTHFAAAVQPV